MKVFYFFIFSVERPSPKKGIFNFDFDIGPVARTAIDFARRNKNLIGLAALGTGAAIGAGTLLYKNRKKIARGAKKLFKNTVDAISYPFSKFFNSSKSPKKRRKMSNENQEMKPLSPHEPLLPVDPLPSSPPASQPVLRELDEYGSPSPITIAEALGEEPSEDKVFYAVSPANTGEKYPVIEARTISSNLVPVRGNSKVMRCLNCKTFVSASKPHTAEECAARKLKEITSTSSTKKRRRKVDKDLLKNFRMLERKSDAVAAKGAVISKKAQALIKKFNKKSKKTSPTIPKQVMSFLDYVCKKF